MKKFLAISLLLGGLSGCSLFGGGDKPGPQPSSPGGGGLGTFHPGPYKDEATGKSCNAPGGYCEDDKQCHSSAAKCKKQ